MLRKLKMQNASLCIASIMNHTVYLIFFIIQGFSRAFSLCIVIISIHSIRLKFKFKQQIFSLPKKWIWHIFSMQLQHWCLLKWPKRRLTVPFLTRWRKPRLILSSTIPIISLPNKQQTKHLTHQTNKRYVTPTRARHKTANTNKLRCFINNYGNYEVCFPPGLK